MSDLFQEELQALRAHSLQRKLREIGTAQGASVDLVGKRLVNFSSNDYLGLANDARLREAAIATIAEFGMGAGASRLISGTQSPHLRLENALAKWKGTQAALAFSSGYSAAVGTLPALATKNDIILLDKLCHASLIDGAKLSGAALRVFPHNHLGKLESQLEWARRERPQARIVIATESIFSMDGDRAPLAEMIGLKKRFRALLLLDEAHAIGVAGPNGRGLAAELGLDSEVDVQMGTLSKALGVSGGYICGRRTLIEWLINRARSFIFSTAPPASLASAAVAAIEFLSSEQGEERRLALWEKIALMAKFLPPDRSGRPTPSHPASAIFPWIVGDEQAALDLSTELMSEGFFAPAVRYPTVAKGSARLRISVTASHDDAQIEAFSASLRRLCRTTNQDQGVREAAQ
ncbi:MAG: 8-amino-7-oxononanoate synthase [Verrucomicrobiota bacterium]|jgi:8-amino-7-oxononanoate synthase